MPRVSIVIPNYNGYGFLKDCLDSLRKQSFHLSQKKSIRYKIRVCKKLSFLQTLIYLGIGKNVSERTNRAKAQALGTRRRTRVRREAKFVRSKKA